MGTTTPPCRNILAKYVTSQQTPFTMLVSTHGCFSFCMAMNAIERFHAITKDAVERAVHNDGKYLETDLDKIAQAAADAAREMRINRLKPRKRTLVLTS